MINKTVIDVVDKIDVHCNKILKILKKEELSMLDLARFAARFKMMGSLFQSTLDRLQEKHTAILQGKPFNGNKKKH